MSESKEEVSSRPWLRLHAFTWLVIVLMMIPYVMVAFPKSTFFTNSPRSVRVALQGWPAIHSVHLEPGNLPEMGTLEEVWKEVGGELENYDKPDSFIVWARNPLALNKPFWSDGNAWKIDGYDCQRYWLVRGLVVNLLAIVAYVGLITLTSEFYCRRNRRWFQFSMGEYVFGVAVLCLVTFMVNGLFVKARRQTELIQQASEGCELFNPYVQVETPVWLNRLSNYTFDKGVVQVNGGSLSGKDLKTRLPLFSKIRGVRIVHIADGKRVAEVVNELKANIISFNIETGSQETSLFTDRIEGQHVTQLGLFVNDPSADLSFLARFKDLEWLEISGSVHSSQLPVFPKLKVLLMDQRAGSFDAGWAEKLSQMKDVKWLSIEGGEGLDQVLSGLPPQIEDLTLGAKVMEEGFDFTACPKLPNLRRLDLEFPGLDRETMIGEKGVRLGEMVDRFPRLENLLIHNQMPGIMRPVSTLPVMKEFGYDLAPLQIEHLFVSGMQWDEEALKWAASLPNLKSVGGWRVESGPVVNAFRYRPDVEIDLY